MLVASILSMVLGALWYGPLFGKKWMHIIGAKEMKAEENLPAGQAGKQMQKQAMPLYLIQFLLTLFQVYVLAQYIAGWTDASGIENSLWIWAAFVMPTIAGASMWNNDSKEIAWSRFLIQGGYQLVLFVIFGLVLGMWK